MGCVCGKASSPVRDSEESPKHRELIRKTSELQAARASSLKKEGIYTLKEKLGNDGVKIGLVDKKVSGSRRVRDDCFEKGRETSKVLNNFPNIGRVPKAVEGEQVTAGWPSWLVQVAGEAIRGWIPRSAETFEKLDKIGQGTYSNVYKGRDLLNNKVVALKKVRFDNMDPESVKFMAREILILRRLNHPNIIKLEGLITSRSSPSLYLIFEYMEHDLTGIVSLPGVKFTEPQVKCYMKQLLSGLDYCHDNGVLHRDIKGSNLLIDNHGMLKIADFGLASYFDNSQSIPLTSRVVTLWYRPPELLLGATQYGVAVDLWSTGCILGELYTGRPIMPGRTEVEQLHKIFKLCGSPSEDYWRKSKLHHSTVFKPTQSYRCRISDTYKDLPDVAVGLMKTLLSVDPSDRGTANSALKSDFFNTNPLACDPSRLPKYPPSKEMDAKHRDEEKKRQAVIGNKGHKGENDLKRSKELSAAPAPDANAELARSMQQRRQGSSNPKSRSEYFNTHKEESASDFTIGLPSQGFRETSNDSPQRVSYSGPLGSRTGSIVSGRKCNNDTSNISSRNDLSALSGFVPSQASDDKLDSSAPNQLLGRFPDSFGDSMRNNDRRHHHTRIFNGSRKIENGRVDSKDNVPERHDQKEKKIHYSGPLVTSNNIEHLLKEHERRVQEAARRIRSEKTRAGKVRPQEVHNLTYNSMYMSGQNDGRRV